MAPFYLLLEESGLVRSWIGEGDAQVPIGQLRGDSSPCRPGEKADLDQVWLVPVLDRLGFLRERGGDGVEADRPTFELHDHRFQQLAVEGLEADVIDVEHRQREPSRFRGGA